ITGALSFLAGKSECYVKLDNDNIDVDAERERLTKEIDYLKGFLASVEKKLSNERFVQNAKPEIVQNEKNKKADAEAKIAILQENLASLALTADRINVKFPRMVLFYAIFGNFLNSA